MKGIIFNLLEDVVVDAYGDRMWDDLLDTTGLDGVYTESYPVGMFPDTKFSSQHRHGGHRHPGSALQRRRV